MLSIGSGVVSAQNAKSVLSMLTNLSEDQIARVSLDAGLVHRDPPTRSWASRWPKRALCPRISELTQSCRALARDCDL